MSETFGSQTLGGRRSAVVAALAGLALFASYLFAAFRSPGDANVLRYSSSIFDMDVSRVVSDLATAAPSFRASVHPLQKLLVSPVGRAIDTIWFDGGSPLGATQVLIGACMAFAALGAGALAWQLTSGSRSAAVAATALYGFSFSTWLAASIPESAAVASLAAVAPLLFLNARFGKPFTNAEAVGWGAFGVLGFGLTLTQFVFVAVALGVRMTLGRALRDGSRGGRVSPPWRQLALAVAVTAAVGFAGVRAQSLWYPPAVKSQYDDPISGELAFLRIGMLAARPAEHVARLVWHFAVVDFVAPFPARSEFLMRDYGLAYESLSLEEAGLSHWSTPQRVLAAVMIAAVLAGCWGLRRADARFVAPLVCIAAQFALHLLYGREYVLYAPHWHAVLVATLVAGVWRGSSRRRGALLAASFALAAALLANDLAVMDATYREVASDLGVPHAESGDG